jgi:CelD/BcsL family acetyltransferase involved in cellulose biosynthesis
MVERIRHSPVTPTGKEVSGLEVRTHAWNQHTLMSLEPGWRSLTTSGACAEPFFRPEWFEAFASTLAPQSAGLVVVVYAGSEPKGILPLMQANRFFGKIPATTLRSLSNVHSSRFDFIHDGTNTAAVTQSLWRALKARKDWDVLEAQDVPPQGNFRYLMKLAEADGYPVAVWPTRKMPRLTLSCDKATPFQNCPENFKGSRSRLKGKLKKLSEEGAVRFTISTEVSDELLNDFFRLEASGWKGKNGSAIACDPRLVAFYSKVARCAHADKTLRMYSMRAGDRLVAMHFGLFSNSVYYIPKVAYDEAYRKVSPGLLLAKYVIEDLTSIGGTVFDFLGPRMEWKGVWTSEHLEHSHCYIFRPSAGGRFLHTVASRVAPKLRALKHRWKGDPQEWER